MSLLYKEEKINSSQNGLLSYKKFLDGSWQINVPQGEYYSGNYLENMWFNVSRPYKNLKPKQVLILGCGACSVIKSVFKLWPDTKIDALDYDETIINIGKKIYKDFETKKINFIIADAKDFLETSSKFYDFIIVDLFYGNRPITLLREENFLKQLRRAVSNNGMVIANLATGLGGDDKEIFEAWKKTFPESKPEKYFSNKLFSVIVKNIPSGYKNIFQTEIYTDALKRDGLIILKQSNNFYYVQKFPFGFSIISAIHTDLEPDIDFIKKEVRVKHGIIFWSQWRNSYAPRPWRKNFLSPLHQAGNGLLVLTENYRNKWSESARRDLKKFLSSSTTIKSVTREEFIADLMASVLRKSLKNIFKKSLESKFKDTPLKFWIAEKNGKPQSALCVVNYEKCSAHVLAYSSNKAGDNFAGTGLIDFWCLNSLKNNIKYLNFGHIRQVNEPRSWEGFSIFKKKFIDMEIKIPNQYFRFF